MMTLEQLPPKGVKREQAILELGKVPNCIYWPLGDPPGNGCRHL